MNILIHLCLCFPITYPSNTASIATPITIAFLQCNHINTIHFLDQYEHPIKQYCVPRVDSIADNDMNSVHYLLFIPFHIGSAEIEKAAKVRKFKDFHESVRCSPIIVSTCPL